MSRTEQYAMRRWLVYGDCACAKCGGVDKIHMHHIDSTTKCNNVSSMLMGDIAKLYEEVAKCLPLCEKCHMGLHKAKGRKVTAIMTFAYLSE